MFETSDDFDHIKIPIQLTESEIVYAILNSTGAYNKDATCAKEKWSRTNTVTLFTSERKSSTV